MTERQGDKRDVVYAWIPDLQEAEQNGDAMVEIKMTPAEGYAPLYFRSAVERNAVIEECAKVLDADECYFAAEQIRALKNNAGANGDLTTGSDARNATKPAEQLRHQSTSSSVGRIGHEDDMVPVRRVDLQQAAGCVWRDSVASQKADEPDAEAELLALRDRLWAALETPPSAIRTIEGAPTVNDLLTLLDELEGIQAGYEVCGAEGRVRLDTERHDCRERLMKLFRAAQDATYPPYPTDREGA